MFVSNGDFLLESDSTTVPDEDAKPSVAAIPGQSLFRKNEVEFVAFQVYHVMVSVLLLLALVLHGYGGDQVCFR